MKYNKLRYLLDNNLPSVATRLWSTWPFYMEALGAVGHFDYAEFVAEYSPYTQFDMENLARAAEIHEMGTMIKIDFLHREYVAQKAIGAGFQAILFADHRNAKEIEQSVKAVKPATPDWEGGYGFPTRRFIGTNSSLNQMDHAKRIDEVVLCFMIEKATALDEIEQICQIRGVDMLQFGPADYSMSLGFNMHENREKTLEAERKMIETALRYGVQPRCEIHSPEDAKYYIDLGVRHFCLGDQFAILRKYWNEQGVQMRDIADKLK